MHGYFALLALSILVASPASAQRSPRPMSEGMQVNASFQTLIPIAPQASVQDESKATEAARQNLYELASRECEIIGRVFKGECQLVNLGVNSNVQDRGNGLRGIHISVNASFRVVPAEAGK